MVGGGSNNSGDESKPSTLYDHSTPASSSSSSSPTQPLLSKHFPPQPYPSSFEDYDGQSPHAAADASEERDDPGPISYRHGPRPCRDLPCLLFFLLLSVATFALGIFSVAHRNPNSSHVSSFSFDPNTTSCFRRPPVDTEPSPWLLLNSHLSSSSPLVKDLVWTLVVTLVLSFPLVLALLWVLRHYAKQIVYISLPFFILIPAFFNIYWFVACTVSAGCRENFPIAYRILVLVFVFLLIGIVAWIIVANWHRIELTIRIVGISSDALARNMGLFAVLPGLALGLAVYFAPIVVFLVFSPQNGKIVPRVGKEGEYHCAWKQDSWVPAYYALGIVTMLWSLTAMVEAQVYVTSGTIAQWYFSKEGEKPSRSLRSSLRNAFGPSFGTVCFSGLIMGAVRIVRAIVDSAKQEDGASGIVNVILQCCANIVLSAIHFLNKFTVTFAAITGEGYCYSAKMTYELLKRNLLSAVFVETVSTRILVGIICVLSAVYAIVVCAILKAVSALGVEAYFVAVLAWLLLIVVLGLFVHVLDNVIDTVYVCYAIDRDKGEVCKQEVHEVYVLLPINKNDRPSLATRAPLVV